MQSGNHNPNNSYKKARSMPSNAHKADNFTLAGISTSTDLNRKLIEPLIKSVA